MNWKCLLVGLVLVFPGSLLSVEGRYYSEDSRAVRERESFLSSLYNLFSEQRQLENYYGQPQEASPPAQKKLGPDDNNNNNNNNDGAEHVQKFEKATAEKADGTPPVQEPASAKATGKSSQGRINHADQGQINHAVQEPQALRQSQDGKQGISGGGVSKFNTVFVLVVVGCTVLAAVGIVGAGVCWYKYNKGAKAASVVDYPAYGVTGPTKDRAPSPGDRKLAHSAQMYHYQHQKQQMMALQSASSGEMKHDASDDESVEDNDDADYTVYECPGLAPTGEMEVKNPLFRGDDTPSTPANDDTHPPPPEY